MIWEELGVRLASDYDQNILYGCIILSKNKKFIFLKRKTIEFERWCVESTHREFYFTSRNKFNEYI